MSNITLQLTSKQTKLLQPIFDMALNELGMVVGQFHEAMEGNGFFTVGFIGTKKSLKLQKALNIPMNITPRFRNVYTDVEDK